MTKVCSICKKEWELSIANFDFDKRSPDGYSYKCKECRKSYANEYGGKHREKQHTSYKKMVTSRVSRGLCSKCGINPVSKLNKNLCDSCRIIEIERKNKLTHARKELGLCPCGEPSVKGRYCQHCYDVRSRERKEKRVQFNVRGRARMALIKEDVFNHYGGYICACCGETEKMFLTLDHMNNDGAKQRKNGLKGDRIFRWLQKNNYPSGYQILCSNCNSGRFRNGGVCPHEDERQKNKLIEPRVYTLSEYSNLES